MRPEAVRGNSHPSKLAVRGVSRSAREMMFSVQSNTNKTLCLLLLVSGLLWTASLTANTPPPLLSNFLISGANNQINKLTPGKKLSNLQIPLINNNSVAYNGGLYVAVGDFGSILTSTNGSEWTSQISGISTPLHGVTFGKGKFVTVGDGGVVLT